MVADLNTNTVFVSNLLPEDFPTEFGKLHELIKSAGYKLELLAETNDYFCRDYMPIQVDQERFVQFIFRPKAYHSLNEYQYISNPITIELYNAGKFPQPVYSTIVLDGGNVVKGAKKALVSERVFADNAHQFGNQQEIIARLSKELNAEILIIPEYPGEATGHADGLVRFMDDKRVFINEANPEQKEWEAAFREKLKNEYQLECIELPCTVDDKAESAKGLYLNYLQVGKLVIVPQFGDVETDNKALDLIKQAYGSAFTVEGLNANWIAQYGGVFNCMSWNINK